MALSPPRPPDDPAAQVNLPAFRVPAPHVPFHEMAAAMIRDPSSESPFPVLITASLQTEITGADMAVQYTAPSIPHAQSGLLTRVLDGRQRTQQAAGSNSFMDRLAEVRQRERSAEHTRTHTHTTGVPHPLLTLLAVCLLLFSGAYRLRELRDSLSVMVATARDHPEPSSDDARGVAFLTTGSRLVGSAAVELSVLQNLARGALDAQSPWRAQLPPEMTESQELQAATPQERNEIQALARQLLRDRYGAAALPDAVAMQGVAAAASRNRRAEAAAEAAAGAAASREGLAEIGLSASAPPPPGPGRAVRSHMHAPVTNNPIRALRDRAPDVSSPQFDGRCMQEVDAALRQHGVDPGLADSLSDEALNEALKKAKVKVEKLADFPEMQYNPEPAARPAPAAAAAASEAQGSGAAAAASTHRPPLTRLQHQRPPSAPREEINRFRTAVPDSIYETLNDDRSASAAAHTHTHHPILLRATAAASRCATMFAHSAVSTCVCVCV